MVEAASSSAPTTAASASSRTTSAVPPSAPLTFSMPDFIAALSNSGYTIESLLGLMKREEEAATIPPAVVKAEESETAIPPAVVKPEDTQRDDRGHAVLEQHGYAMSLPTAGGAGNASRVPREHLDNVIAALEELRISQDLVHSDALLAQRLAVDGNFAYRPTGAVRPFTAAPGTPAPTTEADTAANLPMSTSEDVTPISVSSDLTHCPWCHNSLTDEAPPPVNPLNTDKWYSVTKGKRVGVFQGWGYAQPYVSGVSNACFKGYKTQALALNAFNMARAAGHVVVLP